jgi:hypothetical protein
MLEQHYLKTHPSKDIYCVPEAYAKSQTALNFAPACEAFSLFSCASAVVSLANSCEPACAPTFKIEPPLNDWLTSSAIPEALTFHGKIEINIDGEARTCQSASELVTNFLTVVIKSKVASDETQVLASRGGSRWAAARRKRHSR